MLKKRKHKVKRRNTELSLPLVPATAHAPESKVPASAPPAHTQQCSQHLKLVDLCDSPTHATPVWAQVSKNDIKISFAVFRAFLLTRQHLDFSQIFHNSTIFAIADFQIFCFYMLQTNKKMAQFGDKPLEGDHILTFSILNNWKILVFNKICNGMYSAKKIICKINDMM